MNERNTSVTVKRYWFALIVIIGFLIAAVIYIEHNDTNRFQQEERLTVLNKLSTVRARLEGVINGNLLVVTGLSTEFSLNPEITQEEFSRYARLILAQNTQIRNIAAARDLVITHMYPMKGNEKALGLNYRKNEAQRAAVLKARDVGGILLAGPVNLVQGGRGFIARIPIFESAEDNTQDRGRFWGLVSTVIDEERLYKASGLSDPKLPIEIAIRGQDSSGSKGDVFFGRPDLFEDAQVLLDVSLVNGSWQLAGAPKGGWTQETPNAAIIRSVSFVVLLLIIWVTFYRARQKQEKTLVEIAVRESEEKLLRAESVAHLGHWRFSLSDEVLGISPEVCRIFGYDPENYRPTVEESIKCVHADDQNEVKRLFGEAIETGQGFEFERRIVRSDGAVRIVFAKGECEIGDGGKTTSLFGVFQDITDRKRAEEALRERELRMRIILDGISAGFGVEDTNGQTIAANEGWAKILGYTPEEFLKMHFTEYTHPDYSDEDDSLFRELASGKRDRYQVEKRYLAKNGKVIWGRLNRTLVRDEHGNPDYCLGVVEDITERKRAEAALRESEERFSTAFQWNPVALCISRMDDGRHIYVNDRWIWELGHAREEAIGRSSVELGVWADARQRAIFVDRLMSDGFTHDFDALFVTKHGVEKSVAVDGSIIDVNGEQRLLIAFRDVTAHNQMERQLVQAQKMETVGQLTGGVAHDFNNLLQVVETSLELAKETIPQGSEAEKFVNGALRAGHRGAKLTQQLLAFSRKQTLHPEIIRARSLVDGMTSILTRTLGEDISIKTEFADGVANIYVDENGLTNALLNLAVNARAAMPKGGTLTVAVGKRHFDTDIPVETDVLSSGDYVEIAVTDTGCGISEENLSHVFEPFFTTKGVGEGSGMGLSMVYGFARQSGGNVTIESELGKGTTVRLVLPAADGEVVSTSDTQAAQKDVKHAIKVLLVEDDADVRAATLMLLKSLGCEVVEAATAAPVPDILRQDDSIDLLLSDVVLPGGKNGIELAQEAVRLRPTLKVVLVSGYPERMLEMDGLKETGFRLLGKPYTSGALSEALGSVVAQ